MGGLEGLMEMLGNGEGASGGNRDAHRDYDLNEVQKALARPALTDLKRGDLIVQQMFGSSFVDKCKDKPVVFVRYLTDLEKALYNAPRQYGNPVTHDDIFMCYFVETQGGQWIQVMGDSTNYERYEHPAEKLLAEIEAEEDKS